MLTILRSFMRKLHKIAFAVALATTVAACNSPQSAVTDSPLPAGISLIADQSQSTGLAIPHKKYKLANGLTVIVHEDNSDPLVHVDVTYHVGSAREEPGKSGFAHFFEHMMFQGSEHIADEQHLKIITEAGGTLNGTTNADRTNYFQTVPVNQLEKVLWLEADRMGFLLDAVTEKKFEVQRETVKNERGQRVDNQPYGRLNERVSQALYPDLHPYSWPVIGWMDDLNRANVNDVKAFFLRWYGPNNATLTIGGDVKAEQILPLVQKYFGSIPVGPEVTATPKQLITLSEDRYISMEDNVHLPLLYLTFPSVYAQHPDEAPLDILAEILGGGNNSLLYKNLVKNQIAVQANVSHSCMELACNFSLYALPHPASGKNLAAIEQVIRASLLEFEQRGVSDDDLLKVKAGIEAGSIFGLQSVQGKVSQLAYSETFFGQPDQVAADIARYNAVTKADVLRVYNQYIKGKHAVLMSVVPKGQQALIARADNFKPVAHDFGGPSTTKAEDLQARRATDTFDRSVQPKAGNNPAVNLPATWRSEFSNGIAVLGAQTTETPTTSLLLKIPSGLYYETADQVGISAMVASLMNESTKNYSTEQMSLALEKLGSKISFGTESEYLTVFVSSLSKNLPATLALLEEKLLNPAFAPQDVHRVQQQTLQGLQNAEKNAGYLAQQAYRKLMYGNHIMGFNAEGTLATVSKLTPADLQSYHQLMVKPTGSQLIVVSDLPQAEVQPFIDKTLQKWQGTAPALNLTVPTAIAKAGTIYLVDKPDAPQSEIRIGKRSITEDITGEYYRAGLMNFVLGGNFNSRINLNLREEKGYTYGAFSGFAADKFAGVYTAQAAVRADATAAAIAEFLKELDRYQQQGITDDELNFMRQAINQADALKYETPNAKLGFMARILEHNLSPDFVQQRNQIVATISKEEINALAKKHLNSKEMSIVVVGDAKTLRPKLQTLGLTVVDYKL
jgi:zinc protease